MEPHRRSFDLSPPNQEFNERKRELEQQFHSRYDALRWECVLTERLELEMWKENDLDEFRKYEFSDLIALEEPLLSLMDKSYSDILWELYYVSKNPDRQSEAARGLRRYLRMHERLRTLRRTINFAAEHGMEELRKASNEDIPDSPAAWRRKVESIRLVLSDPELRRSLMGKDKSALYRKADELSAGKKSEAPADSYAKDFQRNMEGGEPKDVEAWCIYCGIDPSGNGESSLDA